MRFLPLLLSLPVWAQEAAPGPKPSTFETLIMPMGLIFIIMYFFILRPQNRRAQTQQKFLAGLKRGDSVLTSSGILGTIEGLTDRFITLEIADGVKIRVLRTHVAGPMQEEKKS
jgi:preprotein translocase subunit YajC